MSETDDPSTWRLRTPRYDIPYRKVDEEGYFERNSTNITHKYIVPSGRVVQFANEAFPEPIVVGGAIVYPPALSPLPFLSPKRVSFRGYTSGRPIDILNMDPTAPQGTYEPFVEVTVDYETKEQESFLEISGEASGEYITSMAPAGKWDEETPPPEEEDDGSGTPNEPDPPEKPKHNFVTTPIHKVVPTTAWTVVVPEVPAVFFNGVFITLLRTNLGFVNSVPMPIFFNAPPETILFMGYSIKRQYTWREMEAPPFRLELKFSEKFIEDNGFIRGHNHFWKPDKGWARMKFNGTEDVYKKKNLNSLLLGFS